MPDNTNNHPPVVFENQVSSAIGINEDHRGHLGALVRNAELERDRIAGILSESGIILESAEGIPDDLGYDNGRFLVLGQRASLARIMEKAREAAPDLSIVPRKPLSEALAAGFHSPFVLKKLQGDARGVNKYLINRPDQFEKLQKYSDVYSQWMTDRWSTEPYIETPGNVNSSYRVVVTSTGVIMASALLYQPREIGKKAEAPFVSEERGLEPPFKPYTSRDNKDGWENFADRESEWFLDADAITSNVSTGGSIIPLKIDGQLGNGDRLNRAQKRVLRSHNIHDQETPKDLLDAAVALGKGVGPEFALLIGIDFLQDKNGKHHMLEMNPYPGSDSILTWWGIDPAKSEGNQVKKNRIQDDLMRVVGASLRDMQDHEN